MTRNEQVQVCQQCLNRKFDLQQGVLCNLTNAKATFQGECGSFLKDEKVKPRAVAVDYAVAEQGKESGQRDMLIGAMWCIGGIVATAANFGYVFWGAIVFGAIQFIRGALNS